MPIKTSDILKSYFETGDKPTQAQFIDLIDSQRHRLDSIPITDVDGLAAILNDLPSDLSSVLSALAEKAAKATTVAGTKSLAGGGDLSQNRTLSLENDEETPGPNKRYGTNGAGVRGWQPNAEVTGTVTGEKSLVGGGDLSENRTLSLENDQQSPGANKVYGTDIEGTRGWQPRDVAQLPDPPLELLTAYGRNRDGSAGFYKLPHTEEQAVPTVIIGQQTFFSLTNNGKVHVFDAQTQPQGHPFRVADATGGFRSITLLLRNNQFGSFVPVFANAAVMAGYGFNPAPSALTMCVLCQVANAWMVYTDYSLQGALGMTRLGIKNELSGRELDGSDAFCSIRCTAPTAQVYTVPADQFMEGDQLLIEQGGAGKVTVASGAGVVITSPSGLLGTRVQYSMITLVHRGGNNFSLGGDLA